MSHDPLAFLAEPEHSWREQAVCASIDGSAFFPHKGGSTRQVKRICATCPVRVDCLEFALDNGERYGVWGGYSERERRVIEADDDKRASIFADLRSAA